MTFAQIAVLGMVVVCAPLRGQIVTTIPVNIVPRGSAEVPFTLTRTGRVIVQVTATETGVHAGSKLRLLVSLESRTPGQPRWQTSDWTPCSPPPAPTASLGAGGSDPLDHARHAVPIVGQRAPNFMCARVAGDATPQMVATAPKWAVVLRDETHDIRESLSVTVTISQPDGPDRPD
jgi:hypothetical protein